MFVFFACPLVLYCKHLSDHTLLLLHAVQCESLNVVTVPFCAHVTDSYAECGFLVDTVYV
jgi:hypothetical protein